MGHCFYTSRTFRSTWTERIILDKRLEMDKQKQLEDSLVVYDYLILQHSALKCILDRKYNILMNLNTRQIHYEAAQKKRFTICVGGTC